MKYLLDTHVWLWWTAGSERIERSTREKFLSSSNELLVSAASAWEIAIKYRLGKLALPSEPRVYVRAQLALQAIRSLDVTVAHASATADLPLHHSDPFDRLLIAQARCEDLVFVTADRSLAAYDVPQLRL